MTEMRMVEVPVDVLAGLIEGADSEHAYWNCTDAPWIPAHLREAVDGVVSARTGEVYAT